MCVDLGEKKTGCALSDELKIIAQPLTTIPAASQVKLFTAIRELVRKHDVERVVVGYPLHADGGDSPGAARAREFARNLERAGIPSALFDERYSSREAEAVLRAHGKRKKEHRTKVDAIAAAVVLTEYLAELRETR